MKNILIILVLLITCISCEEPQYEHKNVSYTLNNIMLDDDGEYHFIAYNGQYTIQETDCYEVKVIYGDYTPHIVAHYERGVNSPNGWYLQFGNEYTTYLPRDYKLIIFDD